MIQGSPSDDFRNGLKGVKSRNGFMSFSREFFLHESLAMNAECERGGELLSRELEPHDRRKQNPNPLIDGIVPGPDNAKYSGL